jgi:hypothetical protein
LNCRNNSSQIFHRIFMKIIWKGRCQEVIDSHIDVLCQVSLTKLFLILHNRLFFCCWTLVSVSQLISLQFIQYQLGGFYKPTVPQSPPSHLRDCSKCNNARLDFSTIFWSNEWCLKNGLHSGGLNPGPLGHVSSA